MSPIMVLCVAIFGTTLISAATVKWLPNSSFKLPENFKDKKLPCSKQAVVFPQAISGSIEITAGTEVSEFILPENGELILDELLTFGANPADTNCTEGNAYYLDKAISSWNQADVWSSPRFNKATPDSDRVPCFNDVVEFPTDTKFTVKMPEETQDIQAIIVGNKTFTNHRDFWSFAIMGNEQFIANKFLNTGVRFGEPVHCSQFGCACQVYPLKIDCTSKFCPKAPCVHPVKPLGFCCEICGGYVLFDADEGFDMKDFDKLVEDTVIGYDKNSVEYYVGFSPEESTRIQLVVVDKGEYEGLSAEIVNSVSYALHDKWVKGNKVALISGSPLSKSGMGGKIFVSMFFAVVLTLGALYVYYYQIPEVRFPVGSRTMPGVLSRFQRRSDSVVSLTRRDSVISSVSNTGFRNPMYNSKRGRVQVVEPVAEEQHM